MTVPPPVERHVYRNDPIQEALCEFRFRYPETGWAVVAGRLFERLRDLYPAEPDQPVGLIAQPGGGGQAPLALQISIGQNPPGQVRLSNEDRTSQVSVGNKVIAVHSLRPYMGWDDFSERIRRVLGAVNDVFEATFDIERIGLRYINNLDLPEDAVTELDRYFNVSPLQLTGLPLNTSAFLARSEFDVEGHQSGRRLFATFGTLHSPSGRQVLLLDIDAIAMELTDIQSEESAAEVIGELRTLEKAAFEGAVTDYTKTEVFGGWG